MDQNLKLLIFLIVLIKLATSQYTEKEAMDSKMTSNRDALINKETYLSYVLGNLSESITNISAILKSEYLSKDLVTSLDSLNSMVKLQMTIKNFEPYVNISTCGDINYKMIMIEFDQQSIMKVISNVQKNISLLPPLYSKVAIYSSQIVLTTYYSTVRAIYLKAVSMVTEYSKYISLLSTSYSNMASFNVQLQVFKKKYCTCLSKVSMTGNFFDLFL